MSTVRLPHRRATAGLAAAAVAAAGLACLAPSAHAAPAGLPTQLAFEPVDLASAGDRVVAVGSVSVDEDDDGEYEESNGYLAVVGTGRVVDLGPLTTADDVELTSDGDTAYVLGSAQGLPAGTHTAVWAVDTTTGEHEVVRTFGAGDWLAGIVIGPSDGLLAFGSQDSEGRVWAGEDLQEANPASPEPGFVPLDFQVDTDPGTDGEADRILGMMAGQTAGEHGASTPALWRLHSAGVERIDLDEDVTGLTGLAVDAASGTAYVGTEVDNPGAGEDEPSALDALTVVRDDDVSRVALDSAAWSLALSADGGTLFATGGYGVAALDTAALDSYDDEHQPPTSYLDARVSSLVTGSDRLYAADREGMRVLSLGAPSAPTGLTARADFANRLEASWTASTDAGGIDPEDLSYTVVVQDRAGGAPIRKERLWATEHLYGYLGIDVLPGHTYDVSVLATNGAFTSAATTTTVAVPVPVAGPGAIAVVGSMKVGSRLSVRNVRGAWAPGTRLAYHWVLDSRSTGSTAATFTLTPAHLGRTVSVSVTGTKAGFAETTLWTVPVKVAPGTLSKATPRITGKARVGQRLTAKPGTWTAGTTLRYRWAANGKAIKGATGRALKLKAAQRGKRITVTVTGTKPGYAAASAVSGRTAKVAKAAKATKRRR